MVLQHVWDDEELCFNVATKDLKFLKDPSEEHLAVVCLRQAAVPVSPQGELRSLLTSVVVC